MGAAWPTSAPRPLTVAEVDRRLVDLRAAYYAAFERGDLPTADERWAELNAMLEVRFLTPQQRKP